ncbi:hypothetical protein QBC47DRAFT_395773 [Echria macrotheca]|uniref:Steroid 5-alpha reductase C-terminal domain-containing protein n=1 Tax=Echria macrotheca TaxID=438768 RepID=A0AAJ0F114_9PEZI|nr:hypothetical protein QBC47DRAFT_395773 [Echria macrotheca]
MASNPDAKPPSSHAGRDVVSRGRYGPSPLGSATFIGLRTADTLLQYNLLTSGRGAAMLSRLGIATLSPAAHPPSNFLSHSPLPLSTLIIVSMATGSALKQIYWLLHLSREEFPPKAALVVSTYNTLVNTLGSLLLLSASTSAVLATPTVPIPGLGGARISLPTAVGVVMYVVGMTLETVAEEQRKRFKDDPKNKGKICTSGLWGMARHINYGGYTLWRTGYWLAAGGWAAGAAMLAWHSWTFLHSSIPILNEYMGKRYGEQWERYTRDVKYALIPGII